MTRSYNKIIKETKKENNNIFSIIDLILEKYNVYSKEVKLYKKDRDNIAAGNICEHCNDFLKQSKIVFDNTSGNKIKKYEFYVGNKFTRKAEVIKLLKEVLSIYKIKFDIKESKYITTFEFKVKTVI